MFSRTLLPGDHEFEASYTGHRVSQSAYSAVPQRVGPGEVQRLMMTVPANKVGSSRYVVQLLNVSFYWRNAILACHWECDRAVRGERLKSRKIMGLDMSL
jgi:hypothetical protein